MELSEAIDRYNEQGTKDDYKKAKIVVYSLLYGSAPHLTSDTLCAIIERKTSTRRKQQ